MEDSDCRSCEPLVQCQNAFVLCDHYHGSEHICWIGAFIMQFAVASEYLCLHARANQPKRIRNHVTGEASNASRDRIQVKGTLFPSESLFALQLDCLIHGKVDRVEKRSAKSRNVIPSEEASHAFFVDDFANRPEFELCIIALCTTHDVGMTRQKIWTYLNLHVRFDNLKGKTASDGDQAGNVTSQRAYHR